MLILVQPDSRSLLLTHVGKCTVRAACCSSHKLSTCAALPLDRNHDPPRAAVVSMLVQVDALREVMRCTHDPKSSPSSIDLISQPLLLGAGHTCVFSAASHIRDWKLASPAT